MNIRKILSAMTCSILAITAANAVQISSVKYVDDSVAAKSDLQGTGAVEVATVDANGQYVRSGTAMSDLATDTEVASAITTALGEVAGDIETVVESIDADVEGKADKVIGAVLGNLAGLDASGNLTDSGVSPTDFLQDADLQGIWDNLDQLEQDKAASDEYFREEIKKNSDLDAVIRDLIVNQADENNDGVRDGEVYVVRDRLDTLEQDVANIDTSLDGVEVVENRVDAIVGASATAYPSVGAIRQYALPVPPADCATSQCVLSVQGESGEPYWEVVALQVTE